MCPQDAAGVIQRVWRQHTSHTLPEQHMSREPQLLPHVHVHADGSKTGFIHPDQNAIEWNMDRHGSRVRENRQTGRACDGQPSQCQDLTRRLQCVMAQRTQTLTVAERASAVVLVQLWWRRYLQRCETTRAQQRRRKEATVMRTQAVTRIQRWWRRGVQWRKEKAIKRRLQYASYVQQARA